MSVLTVECPVAKCAAPIGQPCGVTGGSHRLRRILSYRGRQQSVRCPSCHSPPNTLCAHLNQGPPNWNVHFHEERDVAAYAASTDVICGLTYPDGSPVRPGWILREQTIKKDKLHVIRFDAVKGYNTFTACSWDKRVWYAASRMNDAKKLARQLDTITRLGDLGREPRTHWKPGKAKGSRKM